MSSGDLVTIAPLIVAVLTAAAVLVVDLIWPGRSRPAIATAFFGLALLWAPEGERRIGLAA